MKAAGLRGDVDLRNEKINLKVREHSLAKVPVIVAVGRQEVESGKVAVRRLGEKGQQILDLDDAIASLVEESRIPGT
jgi:threonyl-tRNA synthetase